MYILSTTSEYPLWKVRLLQTHLSFYSLPPPSSSLSQFRLSYAMALFTSPPWTELNLVFAPVIYCNAAAPLGHSRSQAERFTEAWALYFTSSQGAQSTALFTGGPKRAVSPSLSSWHFCWDTRPLNTHGMWQDGIAPFLQQENSFPVLLIPHHCYTVQLQAWKSQ